MGKSCEACGEEMHGLYASCIADRVQMSDEEHVEAMMSRIAADVITRHAATLERLALVDRLRTLAANLATAGALCQRRLEMVELGLADDWRPGCGRPMPGWGGGE